MGPAGAGWESDVTREILFQCAPNFSEGRCEEIVEEIAEAARGAAGARLIDVNADPDHNRCVLTVLGGEEAVEESAVAMARAALRRIDLRTHSGAHPRTGAVDVLPVVPLRGASRERAVAVARRIGRRLALDLDLPVIFYEWASPGEPRALPEIRRALGAAGLPRSEDRSIRPDLGPEVIGPSAGVAIVGARGPLVAYNVNLATASVEIACRIAARIRAARRTDPQLSGVRALGIYLVGRARAQVSMNLTEPERTPLPYVFDYVRSAAREEGSEAAESEIIGAIPLASLAGASPASILWSRYRPEQILETWTGTDDERP
jgi:glutamate formiminotransferase